MHGTAHMHEAAAPSVHDRTHSTTIGHLLLTVTGHAEQAANVAELNRKLAELEAAASAAGLWDSQERAQATLQQMADVKGTLEEVEAFQALLADVSTAAELAQLEVCAAALPCCALDWSCMASTKITHGQTYECATCTFVQFGSSQWVIQKSDRASRSRCHSKLDVQSAMHAGCRRARRSRRSCARARACCASWSGAWRAGTCSGCWAATTTRGRRCSASRCLPDLAAFVAKHLTWGPEMVQALAVPQ